MINSLFKLFFSNSDSIKKMNKRKNSQYCFTPFKIECIKPNISPKAANLTPKEAQGKFVYLIIYLYIMNH